MRQARKRFRNLKAIYSFSGKNKAANNVIGWMVVAEKCLETCILIAYISFQPFITELVLTFTRHFSSRTVTVWSLFVFCGPPFFQEYGKYPSVFSASYQLTYRQ